MSDVLSAVKELNENVTKIIETHRNEFNSALEKNTAESAEYKEKSEKMFNEFSTLTDTQKELNKKLEEIEKNQERLEAFQNGSSVSREANAAEAKKKELNCVVDLLRNGMRGENLIDRARELNLISTDSNPDGGYAVYPQLEGLRVGRFFETSDIRSVCTVKNTSRQEIIIEIDDDEAAAARKPERSASSNTDTPEIEQLSILVKKYDSEPGVTHEAAQDMYFDAESWLNNKAFDKITRLQNTDSITGTGVNGLRGILSYTAASDVDTYEYGKIGQLTSSVSGDFAADDMIKLLGYMKAPYINNNTKIAMNRRTFFHKLLLKKNGFGDYLFLDNLKDAMSGMKFMGIDIKLWDDMPDVASSALSIVIADFKKCYEIYDRPGMLLIRDLFTDKSKIKLYTAVRSGGGVTNFDGIKILKCQA